MQFNYKGSGKSLEAGTRTAQAAVDFYATNRENSPDFTNLAKEAIKSRSNERRAAIAAESQVAQTGLQAKADVEFEKIDAKTQKAVRDIKRPAARMAGIVSAASTLGGVAVTSHLNKQADAKWEAREAKRMASQQKLIDAFENAKVPEPELPEPPPQMEKPQLEDYETSDTKGGSGTPLTPEQRSVSDSGTAKPGQVITQAQGKQLLMDQGMDEQNATIGAAVMMAESRGKSDARSHPDLEASTGEMSIGLWQHNKNTGEDRHAFYGIKNWDELKDPQTNARATYRLWKRAGGKWTDWGAYTDGGYKDFL